MEREIAIRRRLESVFGISFAEEEHRESRASIEAREESLARRLRAAGF
jgi:hypothetical protein